MGRLLGLLAAVLFGFCPLSSIHTTTDSGSRSLADERGNRPVGTGCVPSAPRPIPFPEWMSNPWSFVTLCGPRNPKPFGNTAILIVLPHYSHRHITVIL